MIRKAMFVVFSFSLVTTCATIGSALASDSAVDWTAWEQMDCVQRLLPRDYSFVRGYAPVGTGELGVAEIKLLMDALPPGLPDDIRKATKRLWPNEKKFYSAVGKNLNGASFKLMGEVSRLLYKNNNLSMCREYKKSDMLSSIWPFVIDVVGRPVRDNVEYQAMGGAGPYYVLMMLGGQANGYEKAPAYVLEYARKQ